MKNKSKNMKKALKELIDKNKRPRHGSMCVIAYHPAMARDIGKPLLKKSDTI